MKSSLENPEAVIVSLSEVINHAAFPPALRDLVNAMAERDLALEDIIAALGLDAQTVGQTIVAQAVGNAVMHCCEIDAAKARGLN